MTRKPRPKILFLLGVLILAFPVSSFAQTQRPEQAASIPDAVRQGAEAYFSANRLIGREVRNEQGEKLGEVHDVIVGREGRSDFLILSRGGFLGLGRRLVPVPALVIAGLPHEGRNDHLVVTLTDKQLDNAPKYSEDEWPTLRASQWEEKVYGYYGIQDVPPESGIFGSQRNRQEIDVVPGRGMPETSGAERMK